MVIWPYKPKLDEEGITRLILFEDEVRIDLQILRLKEVDYSRYVNGYTILVDKDEMTKELPNPTYDEFIIKKPSKEDFESVVNEFWWNVYMFQNIYERPVTILKIYA